MDPQRPVCPEPDNVALVFIPLRFPARPQKSICDQEYTAEMIFFNVHNPPPFRDFPMQSLQQEVLSYAFPRCITHIILSGRKRKSFKRADCFRKNVRTVEETSFRIFISMHLCHAFPQFLCIRYSDISNKTHVIITEQELLYHHTADCRSKQLRICTKTDHALNSRRHIRGVNCSDNEMPGKCSAYGCQCSFLITYFPDHNNVRILTECSAERFMNTPSCSSVRTYLHNTVQRKFRRIFYTYYFSASAGNIPYRTYHSCGSC